MNMYIDIMHMYNQDDDIVNYLYLLDILCNVLMIVDALKVRCLSLSPKLQYRLFNYRRC